VWSWEQGKKKRKKGGGAGLAPPPESARGKFKRKEKGGGAASGAALWCGREKGEGSKKPQRGVHHLPRKNRNWEREKKPLPTEKNHQK